jgi:serine/threonine protein phosphatase PrpC
MRNKPLFVTKRSSIGSREENQDSILYETRKGILLVADGLGGKNHAQGKVASTLTTMLMHKYLRENHDMLKTKRITNQDILKWLTRSIIKTNEAISQLATTPAFYNTATTLEASHIYDNILHYAHVGDSATFIIRPYDKQEGLIGSIELLAEEQTTNPGHLGSKLESYIGKKDLEPEQIITKTIPLQKYDIICSCTDGVTKPLLPEDILEIFISHEVKKASREILKRVKHPIYLAEQLKEKNKEHTLRNYLGDNASFIIYQAGD